MIHTLALFVFLKPVNSGVTVLSLYREFSFALGASVSRRGGDQFFFIYLGAKSDPPVRAVQHWNRKLLVGGHLDSPEFFVEVLSVRFFWRQSHPTTNLNNPSRTLLRRKLQQVMHLFGFHNCVVRAIPGGRTYTAPSTSFVFESDGPFFLQTRGVSANSALLITKSLFASFSRTARVTFTCGET